MPNHDQSPDVTEGFRRALREWRRRRELDQSELAEMVGKSQAWITKVEAGGQSVKLEDAAALAAALDVPLTYLVDPGEHDAELFAARADVHRLERELAGRDLMDFLTRGALEVARAWLQAVQGDPDAYNAILERENEPNEASPRGVR